MIRKARRVVSALYRSWLRSLLPERPRHYNGIPVSLAGRWGDALASKFLIITDGDEPEYEQALVTALRQNVRPLDRIVIVGGGVGVTAVIAAKLGGSVICYEGGAEEVRHVIDTANMNGVSVTVHHAVVGNPSHVYGSTDQAMQIAPEALPECDVLELDCEGSEISILSQMTIRPRVVLVETHGVYGAPTERCRELLESRGYTVTDLGLAEPRHEDLCIRDDIHVLVGRLNQR